MSLSTIVAKVAPFYFLSFQCYCVRPGSWSTTLCCFLPYLQLALPIVCFSAQLIGVILAHVSTPLAYMILTFSLLVVLLSFSHSILLGKLDFL